MQYEEALRIWGASRLEQETYGPGTRSRVDPASVYVLMEFNKGFACCGGSDPNCYCSLAESPSAEVRIHGIRGGYPVTASISADDFDFAKVLGEIIDAADGSLSK